MSDTKSRLAPPGKGLLIAALSLLAGCSHTEHVTREMSWSVVSQVPGRIDTLPEGAVRLTFTQAPKFHEGVVVAGLVEHLQASGKERISVDFEIHCKRRRFSLIRIRSVDGLPVETTADNMWSELPGALEPQDSGPFPDVCRY